MREYIFSLGLATEWIEISLVHTSATDNVCLGLATEWIEILIMSECSRTNSGLGLATEWIEMFQYVGVHNRLSSRSCDRVD